MINSYRVGVASGLAGEGGGKSSGRDIIEHCCRTFPTLFIYTIVCLVALFYHFTSAPNSALYRATIKSGRGFLAFKTTTAINTKFDTPLLMTIT